MGKTVVVREVSHHAVEIGGTFVEGKFEQLRRHMPYAAWIQVIAALVRQVLAQSEQRLAFWQSRLQSALQGNGRVLTDVVPELKLIVGDQLPVAFLPPVEAQNRFGRLFQDFFRAFALGSGGLVVFLDDLQWADQSSLQLLETVLDDPELSHFLFVGAYRDTELEPDLPLASFQQRRERAGVPLPRLAVRPLPPAATRELLADLLRCDEERLGELATVIADRTGGNPFHVGQILQMLHQAGQLRIEEGWHWDLDQIRRGSISDDVAGVLIHRLGLLPAQTGRTLGVAACIGMEFDLELLARVQQRAPEATRRDLDDAFRRGLLIGSNGAGRFIHDKVREAAYALLGEAERRAWHRRIGHALLEAKALVEQTDVVYQVAEQLGAACPDLTAEEKPVLSRVCLQAARRAKASAASPAACRFFRQAAALLPESAWSEDYSATLTLYDDWTEAECMATHYAAVEELSAVVVHNARCPLDRVRTRVTLIHFCMSQMKYQEVADLVVRTLNEIGVAFPPWETIGQAATLCEMERFQNRFRDLSSAGLLELPDAPSPYREAVGLLTAGTVAIWCSYPQALLYLSAATVNLTLEHGLCPESQYNLVGLGSCLGAVAGMPKLGYQLGESALRLSQRFGDPFFRVQTRWLFHNMVAFWHEPLRAAIEPFASTYLEASDTGNNQYAAYCINHLCFRRLVAGDDLGSVKQSYDFYAPTLARLKQADASAFFDPPRQLVHNLLGLSPDPGVLEGEFFHEQEALATYRVHQNYPAIGYAGTCRLMLLYLLGDTEGALGVVSEPGMEECFQANAGQIQSYVGRAFLALTYLANHGAASEVEGAKYLAKAEAVQAEFAAYAAQCPHNFQALFSLVSAEVARVKGDGLAAVDACRRAIDAAHAERATHLEALGHELAARTWLDRGHDWYARHHLIEGYRLYRTWGAQAKLRLLEARFPSWLAHEDPSERVGEINPLDTGTVIRATQTISEEIEIERLLQRVMRIVIESAGAERGFLILPHDGHWRIAAVESIDAAEAPAESVDIDRSEVAATGVVRFVARTRERVILGDASTQGQFVDDPNIRRRRVKSLACVPLLHRGRLTGILYLENNLTTDAFTPGRVQLLEALLSQAATSIENARIYQALRQSESRIRSVLRAATAYSIIGTDEHGVVKVFNVGAELMLGYRAEEVIDRLNVVDLHDPEELAVRAKELGLVPGFEVFVQAARRAATETREWSYVRKDDSRLTVSLIVTAMRDDQGALTGFIGIARDISNEKSMEQQLLQSQKMESVGLLAGGVAHDFNNLLLPILGYTEMMLSEMSENDRFWDELGRVRTAAERARDLTRRLLAFSRKQIIELKIVDLGELIRRFESMLRRTIRESITIAVSLPEKLGKVRADPSQIEQILVNLAINAQDAMPNGGTLTIQAAEVELAQVDATQLADIARGPYVSLTVRDTGTGMDEHVLRHLFEPFFTTKEKSKGTGLGLSIVYGIVKQHGGSIAVQSVLGRGSTFQVYLPRLTEALSEEGSSEASAQAVVRGTETILVVEDEPAVRSLVERMLGKLGYRVMVAESAERCLRMVEETAEPIHLLLTDVVMPHHNGRELYQLSLRWQPKLKVVYMSGYSNDVIGDHGVLSEGLFLLAKPFSLQSLSSKIRQALDT